MKSVCEIKCIVILRADLLYVNLLLSETFSFCETTAKFCLSSSVVSNIRQAYSLDWICWIGIFSSHWLQFCIICHHCDGKIVVLNMTPGQLFRVKNG